jgi:hypothetical protein
MQVGQHRAILELEIQDAEVLRRGAGRASLADRERE